MTRISNGLEEFYRVNVPVWRNRILFTSIYGVVLLALVLLNAVVFFGNPGRYWFNGIAMVLVLGAIGVCGWSINVYRKLIKNAER